MPNGSSRRQTISLEANVTFHTVNKINSIKTISDSLSGFVCLVVYSSLVILQAVYLYITNNEYMVDLCPSICTEWGPLQLYTLTCVCFGAPELFMWPCDVTRKFFQSSLWCCNGELVSSLELVLSLVTVV